MKRVLLFLAQGFEEYEASVFTDVIGWSRVFGIEPVDLVTTGLRSGILAKRKATTYDLLDGLRRKQHADCSGQEYNYIDRTLNWSRCCI